MTCDVLVIGAGPAGSAAARLLAEWGHRVVIVGRSPRHGVDLAESIPPSARSVLAAIGAMPAIEHAGFQPWRGNTVWWADCQPREESFPRGVAGHQVLRSVFDGLLLSLAVEAGAARLEGVVRDVVLGDSPALAVVEASGQSRSIAASFVLDCSGRAGVIARHGLRIADSAHRTIAVTGVWRADRWPVSDESHTLVASYPDGWAWSVPTEPGVRHVTVMVDPARTALARNASASEVYQHELAKVAPFRPILDCARMTAGPWGADASLYSSTRQAGTAFLLVGDAASFIDPLSSFGVKKALASGWLAAIAANTALVRPGMRDEALAFFEARERAMFASASRQARRFAADVASETSHPFWLARAAAPAQLDEADGPSPAEVAAEVAVQSAFNDLRGRPTVKFRLGTSATPVRRPVIRGREIVYDDHLLLPPWPGGIRYLRGIDLVQLARMAPHQTDVGAFFETFVKTRDDIALPDFLGALSVLIAHGALCHTLP